MKSPPPPPLATRLLEALGGDSRFGPLLGDLSEQFAAGRSRSWYWRQIVGALVLDVGRILRQHATSFAAAILVGCALSSLWLLANSVVFRSVYNSLGTGPRPWSWDTLQLFAGLRVAQASLTVLTLASAWLVTRIHRAHQRAVILAFVLALMAQRLPGIVRPVSEAVSSARLPPLLMPSLISTALQGVFTLLPGLWMIRRERFSETTAQIRFAAVGTLALMFISSLLYDAWQVGALNYPRPERYTLDAAEIASCAYLALLFWRRNSQRAGINPSFRGTI
ncbi:MAG: hypothetical protein WDM77_12265 [Steroidobacteraceae bacterium]